MIAHHLSKSIIILLTTIIIYFILMRRGNPPWLPWADTEVRLYDQICLEEIPIFNTLHLPFAGLSAVRLKPVQNVQVYSTTTVMGFTIHMEQEIWEVPGAGAVNSTTLSPGLRMITSR